MCVCVCTRTCTQAKGFELSYLEKVVEVKDTVHRQSLLHHTCSQVVENEPESSDVYSEIPAITRSAKVLVEPPRRFCLGWGRGPFYVEGSGWALLQENLSSLVLPGGL